MVKNTHKLWKYDIEKGFFDTWCKGHGIDPDCEEKMALRKSMDETGSKETWED